jgi:hypothetical protein
MQRVLVVGLPRGGTTWVGRTLAATRGVAYVHEPDGAHEPFAYAARARDGIGYHTILAPGQAAPEYERLWAGAFSGGRAPASLSDRVARWAYRGTTPARRRTAMETGRFPPRLRLALAAARPLAARDDVEGVVVKTVNAALAVEWIAERFSPTVLVVRRDLRNVVASWLRIGFGPPAPRVFEAMRDESRRRFGVDPGEHEEPLARTTVLCAVMSLGLLDALRRHPEWVSISHEAACADPVGELRAGASRAGLTWTDAAEAFVRDSNRPGEGYATQRVAAELPDQWRSRLDEHQADLVDSVLVRYPAELWEAPAGR